MIYGSVRPRHVSIMKMFVYMDARVEDVQDFEACFNDETSRVFAYERDSVVCVLRV